MPSQEHDQSQSTPAYLKVARFSSEGPAGRAYFAAQEAIYSEPRCDLSVYRLQLEKIYHVAVLGDSPPRRLERTLRQILAAGDPASLPPELIQILIERRAQSIKIGPWVERHLHGPRQ